MSITDTLNMVSVWLDCPPTWSIVFKRQERTRECAINNSQGYSPGLGRATETVMALETIGFREERRDDLQVVLQTAPS